MLTQGPVLDPKCKLIILSFLTLSHLLGCLICTRNAMSYCIVITMMGGGCFIYIRMWMGGQGIGIIL